MPSEDPIGNIRTLGNSVNNLVAQVAPADQQARLNDQIDMSNSVLDAVVDFLNKLPTQDDPRLQSQQY